MGEVGTPVRRGVDLPARHLHARGPHAAGARRARAAAGGDVRPGLGVARPGVPLRDPAADGAPAQRLVPRHPGAPRRVGAQLQHHAGASSPTSRPRPRAATSWSSEGGARPRSSTSARGAAATRSGSPSRARASPAYDYVPDGVARRSQRRARGGRPRPRRATAQPARVALDARRGGPAGAPRPGRAPLVARHVADATDAVRPRLAVAVVLDGAAGRRPAATGVLDRRRDDRELGERPVDPRTGHARSCEAHGADIVQRDDLPDRTPARGRTAGSAASGGADGGR